MTEEMLTALLAQQLMGWRVGPDRYLLGQRRWLARWRFQPTKRTEDAFRLLEQAAPQEFTMSTADNGDFWVKVRVAGATGEARAACKPRAMTFAVARAIGIDVELPE
jgi:hypothetical protein